MVEFSNKLDEPVFDNPESPKWGHVAVAVRIVNNKPVSEAEMSIVLKSAIREEEMLRKLMEVYNSFVTEGKIDRAAIISKLLMCVMLESWGENGSLKKREDLFRLAEQRLVAELGKI